MKKQFVKGLLLVALLVPFLSIANGTIEEDWFEIPRPTHIEEEWQVMGKKPVVSPAAYQKLGISGNATPFEILGVRVTTPRDQIRKQYMALIQKWHPDKHADARYATEITQLVTWAYSQIK